MSTNYTSPLIEMKRATIAHELAIMERQKARNEKLRKRRADHDQRDFMRNQTKEVWQ